MTRCHLNHEGLYRYLHALDNFGKFLGYLGKGIGFCSVFLAHSFYFSNNVRRKQGKSWGWTWLTLASISNKEVVRSQRINLNLIFLSMAKSCELYGNTGWDVFKWGIQNHKEFGLFYLWLCWILCPVFLVIKNPIDKLCLHQILVNCLPQ